MTIDIDRIRSETPGVHHVLHLESSGASLLPQVVLDTVREYQEKEALLGGYRVEDDHLGAIETVRADIARLINASAKEIALNDSATRGWTAVLSALPLAAGDIILTSVAEYASNVIAFLQLQKRSGIRFQVIPNDESGQTSVAALQELITPAVKLIAITHTPTNGGLVNPAEEIGAIAQQHGILYLLDACQTVGQYPIDVEKLGCDFLTATGRKFLRGPRGTGFLYVREKHLAWIEPTMLDLYGATWVRADQYEMLPTAQRFEFWEKNCAAILGLGAAVRYCLDLGIENIWERVHSLAEEFRGRLSNISGVTVCDRGVRRCGIVTFRHETLSAEEIVKTLRAEGVNLSTTTAFGTRFDMEERGLSALVRTSVHYYNNEEELVRFCSMLKAVLL